eukprot:gene8739-11110_t
MARGLDASRRAREATSAKVVSKTSIWVRKSALGSRKAGRKATKKVMLLGLSAVTNQAWPSIFAADTASVRGGASSVPPARHSL